jgi:hypothetical protein
LLAVKSTRMCEVLSRVSMWCSNILGEVGGGGRGVDACVCVYVWLWRSSLLRVRGVPMCVVQISGYRSNLSTSRWRLNLPPKAAFKSPVRVRHSNLPPVYGIQIFRLYALLKFPACVRAFKSPACSWRLNLPPVCNVKIFSLCSGREVGTLHHSG